MASAGWSPTKICPKFSFNEVNRFFNRYYSDSVSQSPDCSHNKLFNYNLNQLDDILTSASVNININSLALSYSPTGLTLSQTANEEWGGGNHEYWGHIDLA